MSTFKSIFTEKCPRCEEGNLFNYKAFLPISKKPFEMHKYCPNCGLKYEKEVGFFYGAMFLSYALNVALFVACLVVYLVLFKEKYSWVTFGVVYLILTVLATGYIFRTSRALWLAIFTKRDLNAKDLRNLELLKN